MGLKGNYDLWVMIFAGYNKNNLIQLPFFVTQRQPKAMLEIGFIWMFESYLIMLERYWIKSSRMPLPTD